MVNILIAGINILSCYIHGVLLLEGWFIVFVVALSFKISNIRHLQITLLMLIIEITCHFPHLSNVNCYSNTKVNTLTECANSILAEKASYSF